MLNNLVLTSIETIAGFGVRDGKFRFLLDEVTGWTLENTQENNPVTGKNGGRIATLKKNKAVKVSATNAMINTGLMAVDTGSEVREGESTLLHIETLTVSDHKAITTYKAVGEVGSEIKECYIVDSNGIAGQSLEQDASAAAGKYAYAPATKELTFHTDVEDGTKVAVFYMRKVEAATIASNDPNSYSEECTLYITGLGQDPCKKEYLVQVIIYAADFTGNFNIEFSDSAPTHGFEAESVKYGCGTNQNYWDFIMIPSDAEDAE